MEEIKMLLAALRAAQLVHQTNHWQAQGGHYYADHTMLDRIYNSVDGEIDTLAEKMVGTWGNATVDMADQSKKICKIMDMVASGSEDPIKRSKMMENILCALFKKTYDTLKSSDKLTMGMDDFLMAAHSNHETNQYLLGQRLKQG